MKKFLIAGSVIAAGFLLSACQFGNDAPVSGGNESGDQSPADIIAMPDGFSNVANKCDANGNRVYTMYHSSGSYGSIFVVGADPTCKKAAQ